MRSRSSVGSHGKSNQTRAKASIPLTPLTPAEVRRLLKPHVGFEVFVEPMAALVEAFPQELGAPGIDLDAMRTGLANYQALAEPQAETAKQLALIDATRLLHGSTSWAQLMIAYARARVAARTNVAIKRAIDAFERFMKTGPHKKAGPSPDANTPTK